MELSADATLKALYFQQCAYRRHMHHLYSFNACQMLEWPSLSLAWLPDRKNVDPDRDYSLQYIAVCTQAPPSRQNYINIIEVAVPIEEDEDDDLGFGDSSSDASSEDERSAQQRVQNGVQGASPSSSKRRNPANEFRNIRGHSRIDQTIPCEGQVLKIRAMPQNTDVIAAKTTNGAVSVFDTSLRLSQLGRGETQSLSPELRLRGHRTAGFGLDWSKADSGVIASGSDDCLVLYWDIGSQLRSISDASGTDIMKPSERDVRPVHAFEGHKDVVHDVSWHGTQGHLLASASGDCSSKVWDTRVNKPAMTLENAHRGSCNCVQFHPLASFQIATGGNDNIVKLWDMRKPEKEAHQLIYHAGAVMAIEWAPFAESVLASGGNDGRVVMWDLEKVHASEDYNDDEVAPVELSFVHIGHISRITDLAWNPSIDDEWMLASCDATNTMQYYAPRNDVVYDYVAPDMFDVDNGE